MHRAQGSWPKQRQANKETTQPWKWIPKWVANKLRRRNGLQRWQITRKQPGGDEKWLQAGGRRSAVVDAKQGRRQPSGVRAGKRLTISAANSAHFVLWATDLTAKQSKYSIFQRPYRGLVTYMYIYNGFRWILSINNAITFLLPKKERWWILTTIWPMVIVFPALCLEYQVAFKFATFYCIIAYCKLWIVNENQLSSEFR